MRDAMLRSLDGLSVGDAFGERFFQPPGLLELALKDRKVPGPTPWKWTDDTAMALSVVESLQTEGRIQGAALARRFAARFAEEPLRGYGGGAREVLDQIGGGVKWEAASRSLFKGEGSKGNGAAMRVAPLGAFFADKEEPLSRVVEDAFASAAVTHAHADGQAGAVAVAVAAWGITRDEPLALIWTHVLSRTPHGATRDGLERASRLGFDLPIAEAVRRLGNGTKVLSEDTVPFSVWCALRHLDDYAEAMWNTVSGLGDRDTTCAIVGGLVGLKSPPPREWLKSREALPLRP